MNEADLFYVSAELESKLDPKHGTTADLVIEIVSPGSSIYDRNTKADTYWALGVRELWLVEHTRKSIEVRVTSEAGFVVQGVYSMGDVLSSTVLATLNLQISDIF